MNFAAVFPGQGSQSLGMMNDLAESHPSIKETFQESSDILSKDLWKIVTDGPEELLSQTETTQPLMLTAGVAVWRLWQAQGGIIPSAMAGHSLGEYSALVASETIDFPTAVALVAKRSSLMQQAVPEGVGGMAAILGLTREQVIEGCASAAGEQPSDSDEECRKSVAEQLYRPVKWVDTIQALESNGADTIIEFGPGKVLFGLNRRINRKLGNLTIHDTASFDKALAAVQE